MMRYLIIVIAGVVLLDASEEDSTVENWTAVDSTESDMMAAIAVQEMTAATMQGLTVVIR